MNKRIEEISSTANNFIKELYKNSRLNNGSVIILNFFKSIYEYGELSFEYLLCTKKWYADNSNNDFSKFKKIIFVSKEVLKKLSFVDTKSELLGITNYKYNDIDYSLGKILVLDKVSDPNNLSSIIRSAAALGLKNILISSDSVSPYNEKVLRGSVGSFIFVNISFFNDRKFIIDLLKEKKYQIVSSILNHNSTKINDFNFSSIKNIALVLGNESKGVSDAFIKNSNCSLYIPIKNIDSLNVSAAASIFIYKIMENSNG